MLNMTARPQSNALPLRPYFRLFKLFASLVCCYIGIRMMLVGASAFEYRHPTDLEQIFLYVGVALLALMTILLFLTVSVNGVMRLITMTALTAGALYALFHKDLLLFSFAVTGITGAGTILVSLGFFFEALETKT